MTEIKYTLLSDGSSDRRLIPILTWLLREHCPGKAVQPEWADFSRLYCKPTTLPEKIIKSMDLYPCDILFIHRDAESIPFSERIAEIRAAVHEAAQALSELPVICVVPVRMQEAWILFSESAIRRAASNPRGRVPLSLPDLRSIESLPDAKAVLMSLLLAASGLSGRKLKRLKSDIHRKAHLVAEYIDDFTPLRALPAFSALERELAAFVAERNLISD